MNGPPVMQLLYLCGEVLHDIVYRLGTIPLNTTEILIHADVGIVIVWLK